jgi:lipopolysaccharide/colanic/teichoic acid biosynthesis glycosyltransferase
MLASKTIILSFPGNVPRLFASDSNNSAFKYDDRHNLAAFDASKRFIDICGASILLVATAPLMALTAIAVATTSKGPVLYSQSRLTKGKKVFTMYKFRTMRADAEAKTGAVWACKKDPRITPIGKFLRLSRLDELPQLVNVLSGDMSLIGPRPERPEIAAELSKVMPRFNRRLEVKAGITGLAQIDHGYAASITEYRRKVALDIRYVKNRSILMDTAIAARTLKVIVTGKGAS